MVVMIDMTINWLINLLGGIPAKEASSMRRSVRSVIVVNFALAQFTQSERYFHFPNEPGYQEEQEIYTAKRPALKQAVDKQQWTPYDGN